MELILIIFGTSTVITVLAFFLNSWERNVPVAVAGNIKTVSKGYKCDYKMSVFHLYFYKWKIITPITHQAVFVGGSSMNKFGLKNKEIVFVKKIKKNKPKKIQKGNNILIDVRDYPEKVANEDYKLRCFEGFNDKNKMLVSTYDADGNKYISDKHSIENVVGVVDLKLD